MIENFFKKSGFTDIIISLLFIILGIILIARPDSIMAIIAILLGAICIVLGILKLIEYYSTNKIDRYLLAISIVAIITGIIIMFCAEFIFSIFRILIAIWIIYSGIMNLITAIVWKDFKSKLCLCTILLSILVIIAGIYILTNDGAILQTLGIIIVFYGIVDIIQNLIFINKIDNYLD